MGSPRGRRKRRAAVFPVLESFAEPLVVTLPTRGRDSNTSGDPGKGKSETVGGVDAVGALLHFRLPSCPALPLGIGSWPGTCGLFLGCDTYTTACLRREPGPVLGHGLPCRGVGAPGTGGRYSAPAWLRVSTSCSPLPSLGDAHPRLCERGPGGKESRCRALPPGVYTTPASILQTALLGSTVSRPGSVNLAEVSSLNSWETFCGPRVACAPQL